MRTRASLIAAIIAALLTLTACTGLGPGGPAPAAQRDSPDRGGGDRGGGMM